MVFIYLSTLFFFNSLFGSMHKTPDTFADAVSIADTAAVSTIPLRLEVISSIDELDHHDAAWTQLVDNSQATPFQSFAWNRAWYKSYASEYEEMVVFHFTRGLDTAAIFPCYRNGRSLRLAADIVGDQQDVIAADADAAKEGLREVMRWARKNGCHLRLLQVSERAWLYDAAKSLGLLRNRAFRFQRCYSCCLYADLPESGDAYVQQLPRKIRGDMRRHLNKLGKQHPDANIEIHRAGEAPRGIVGRVADFHAEHFRKEGVSLLSDPRFAAMLDDVAQTPESGLRIATLADGNTTMAIDVGFAFQEAYYGYLTTFDPKYRKLSPGTCLLLRRLDTFIQDDGVKTLDFLLGAERYKSQFAKESYDVCAFYLYPWGIGNAFRWLSVIARRATKLLAKKALNEAGLYKAARSKLVAHKHRNSNARQHNVEVVPASALPPDKMTVTPPRAKLPNT